MKAPRCQSCEENDARYWLTLSDMNGTIVARKAYCGDCIHAAEVEGIGAALDLS